MKSSPLPLDQVTKRLIIQQKVRQNSHSHTICVLADQVGVLKVIVEREVYLFVGQTGKCSKETEKKDVLEKHLWTSDLPFSKWNLNNNRLQTGPKAKVFKPFQHIFEIKLQIS